MKITLVFCLLGLLFSCTSTKEGAESITIEFKIAEVGSAPGLTKMKVRKIDRKFYLHNEVLLNNEDIKSAEYTLWQDRPGVKLIMTERGKEKWADITEQNIGKHIGMILNGELVSAPLVKGRIDVGLAIIQGIFTEDEARKIVEGITRK